MTARIHNLLNPPPSFLRKVASINSGIFGERKIQGSNVKDRAIPSESGSESSSSDEKIRTIKVSGDLELVSPFPAVHMRKSRTLIVSDLHLGIESRLEANGTSIPCSIYRNVADSILLPARELRCSQVYILGDLKHGWRNTDRREERDVKRLVQEIRAVGAEPVLVLGNHDRYLKRTLKELQVKSHESYALLDGILLTHGHKRVKPRHGRGAISGLVMGHEHPAVSLRAEFGSRKETFKSFLVVPEDKGRSEPMMLVLPSVNPLAYGTSVNETPKSDLLSPYLRESSKLWKADVYLLEVGQLLLPFPKLGILRRKSWMQALHALPGSAAG